MWKKNAFSQTHTITIESSTVVAQRLQPVHATFIGNYSQLNQNESAPGSVAIDCQWTPQDVLNLSFVMLSLWFYSYLKWRVDFFILEIILSCTCWDFEGEQNAWQKTQKDGGSKTLKSCAIFFSVLFFGFSALCSSLCAITCWCLFPHMCNEQGHFEI